MAARLEQLNKDYDTLVLISGSTVSLLTDTYPLEPIAEFSYRRIDKLRIDTDFIHGAPWLSAEQLRSAPLFRLFMLDVAVVGLPEAQFTAWRSYKSPYALYWPGE